MSVTQPQYIGVRKRKWGKWVCEIREPGKRTRIWLGSYVEAEMAAAAHDVAALHLKGPNARLNFPEHVHNFPKPVSDRAEDIQMAAQEAARMFQSQRRVEEEDVGAASGAVIGVVPEGAAAARVRLSETEIRAINESSLDSPSKMWMEMELAAGGTVNASSFFVGQQVPSSPLLYSQMWEECDAMDYYSIWD